MPFRGRALVYAAGSYELVDVIMNALLIELPLDKVNSSIVAKMAR